jgi:hypothetical protein
MTPAAIIEQAAAEGVSLTLSPSGTIKATGDQSAISRWLPIIKESKPAIIAMLSEPANDASSWGWRVTYPGGRAFESYIVPEQSFRQVQGIYPGARIEPIAEGAE